LLRPLLLQGADLLEVPYLRRAEEALSQTTNVPVGTLPVGRVPVGASLGSVHRALARRPTFPLIGRHFRRFVLLRAESADPRRRPFGLSTSGFLNGGARLYPPGYHFPLLFSAAAFASWVVLSRRGSGFPCEVAYCLTGVNGRRVGRPRRGLHVPLRRDASELGGSFDAAGMGCPTGWWGRQPSSLEPARGCKPGLQRHRSGTGRSSTFRCSGVTRRKEGTSLSLTVSVFAWPVAAVEGGSWA
jgi:hypothetical protein